MMPGTWLMRLAVRLLHGDTFEFVVSPAIADLQFETPRASRAARVRAYMAVWMALGGAACRDINDDARTLCDDAAILTALAFMQACYYAGMLTLVIDGLGRDQSIALLVAVLALSTTCTLLCFWPSRRGRLEHAP